MGKQTENMKKVHMLLTTLSKIFDSKTFDIHRDTIAEILSIANGIVTQSMKSLKVKHHVIDFILSKEREYTVTIIESSEDICDDVIKYSKEDIKEMDCLNLDHYKKMLEEQMAIQDKYDKLQAERKKEREAKYNEYIEKKEKSKKESEEKWKKFQAEREKERLKKQKEGLKFFLKEKRCEQINNANKAEMLLKDVFDIFGIDYDYQHIEMITKNNGCELKGYIYDFLVRINGKKYDVEVDGSSHDGKEEYDKIRDELSRSIGIETIRFSTQMVYEIEYEVSRGMINKGNLIDIIQGGASSIGDMMSSVRYYFNKCNKYNRRNRQILEPMDESLMNDKVNKNICSIKDVLKNNICGEYREVVYGGKIIPTVTCKTPYTTITCGTNGNKGGDWGHGSRAYVKVECGSLSDYQIRKIDEGDDGESSGFEIAVGGDCEIESLIETLETITSNLKNMKNKIFIEESNKILEKLDNSERKEVFGMINKKINEMNKAKKDAIKN